MNPDISTLTIGLAIGFVVSGIGGVASYWLYLRREAQTSGSPKDILFVLVLLLVFAGSIFIANGILTGTLVQALMIGAGVSLGFALAFTLLVTVYVFLKPAE